MEEKNLPYRPYPARKSDVDQGYEVVPMNGDRKLFDPYSTANLRLDQSYQWEPVESDYICPKDQGVID